jgi:hypothetical protein
MFEQMQLALFQILWQIHGMLLGFSPNGLHPLELIQRVFFGPKALT